MFISKEMKEARSVKRITFEKREVKQGHGIPVGSLKSAF